MYGISVSFVCPEHVLSSRDIRALLKGAPSGLRQKCVLFLLKSSRSEIFKFCFELFGHVGKRLGKTA